MTPKDDSIIRFDELSPTLEQVRLAIYHWFDSSELEEFIDYLENELE